MGVIEAKADRHLGVHTRGHLRALPSDTQVVIDLTGTEPMLEVAGHRMPIDGRRVGLRQRFTTRFLDLSLAVPALVVAGPAMVVLAAMVKLTSRGPVFYSSERLTRDGQVFRMWKFRSMVTNGDRVLADHFAEHPEAELEYQVYRKLADDPRVTRLGRVMRRLSLDELPQLYNVVVGEMSVVGPRPLLPDERDRFGSAYATVGRVKGGLTGLWQVSGRSSLTFDERIVHDVIYVADRTLAGDLRIISRTIRQLLRGDSGAC